MQILLENSGFSVNEKSILFNYKSKKKGYTMIQANNVTLRLGKRALFEDVNIKFTEA